MYSVGDGVAVIRHGSWGRIQLQGLYRVTKSNKVRVHLQRESDGYERIFSAQTGIEKGSERYRSAEIISVDRYNRIKEFDELQEKIKAEWNLIQLYAKNKDLGALKEAIVNLESVLK